jgi:dUTP pyrophosphatase
MLKVKKLDPLAKLPVKKDGDAAYDLYASENVIIHAGTRDVVPTGIAIEFPVGYVGRIVDRSGVAVKEGLHVIAGVMDSSYRGEWLIAFYNTNEKGWVEIKYGTRIAQVLFYEVMDWPVIETDELSETSRGAGRFGSTGRE